MSRPIHAFDIEYLRKFSEIVYATDIESAQKIARQKINTKNGDKLLTVQLKSVPIVNDTTRS